MTREQRVDAAKTIIADAAKRSAIHHRSRVKDNQSSYDEGFANGQIDSAEKLMPLLTEPCGPEPYLVGGLVGIGLGVAAAIVGYWLGGGR